MNNLYKRTVRAAFANPELRTLLLPLLKKARGFVIDPAKGVTADIRDLEAILDAGKGKIRPFQAIVIGFDAKGLQRNRLSSGWGKYEITGQVAASNRGGLWVVNGIDPGYDPQAFKRFVMGSLHQYSLMLPGEISVKARLVENTRVHFIFTGLV